MTTSTDRPDPVREIRPIGWIRSDFPEKFGIPRQPGLVADLIAHVEFADPYRTPDIVRGIEGFSHLWLIWDFSDVSPDHEFSPLVRPPRLGGNQRLGVFATRSPFRPNPLGLSCVRLLDVTVAGSAPRLTVAGADLKDGTPIYDIKPYVPADMQPDADFSWTGRDWQRLTVDFPDNLLGQVPDAKRAAMIGVLAEDPRPAYHEDPDRVYGLSFAGFNISFRVADGALTVIAVEPLAEGSS